MINNSWKIFPQVWALPYYFHTRLAWPRPLAPFHRALPQIERKGNPLPSQRAHHWNFRREGSSDPLLCVHHSSMQPWHRRRRWSFYPVRYGRQNKNRLVNINLNCRTNSSLYGSVNITCLLFHSTLYRAWNKSLQNIAKQDPGSVRAEYLSKGSTKVGPTMKKHLFRLMLNVGRKWHMYLNWFW